MSNTRDALRVRRICTVDISTLAIRILGLVCIKQMFHFTAIITTLCSRAVSIRPLFLAVLLASAFTQPLRHFRARCLEKVRAGNQAALVGMSQFLIGTAMVVLLGAPQISTVIFEVRIAMSNPKPHCHRIIHLPSGILGRSMLPTMKLQT